MPIILCAFPDCDQTFIAQNRRGSPLCPDCRARLAAAGQRFCRLCRQVKTLDEFYSRRPRLGGREARSVHDTRCKSCQHAERRRRTVRRLADDPRESEAQERRPRRRDPGKPTSCEMCAHLENCRQRIRLDLWLCCETLDANDLMRVRRDRVLWRASMEDPSGMDPFMALLGEEERRVVEGGGAGDRA